MAVSLSEGAVRGGGAASWNPRDDLPTERDPRSEWRKALKEKISLLKSNLASCPNERCRKSAMSPLLKALRARIADLKRGVQFYSRIMSECLVDACRDHWNDKIDVLQKLLSKHRNFILDNTKGGKVWREKLKAKIAQGKASLAACQDNTCREQRFPSLERLVKLRIENLKDGLVHRARKLIQCTDDACRTTWLRRIKPLQDIIQDLRNYVLDNKKGGKVWREALKEKIRALKVQYNACKGRDCERDALSDLRAHLEKRIQNLEEGIRIYAKELSECSTKDCRSSRYANIKTLERIIDRHNAFLLANALSQ